MKYLVYGNNRYYSECTVRSQTVNEIWKLLLNRMNIIHSCKSFPANSQNSILWFIGTLCFLFFYTCSFCALANGNSLHHMQLKSVCYKALYNVWQDSTFFPRLETIYFVTSYENNIGILTLNLLKLYRTEVSTVFTNVFFKIKVSHQKTFRNMVCCLFVFYYTPHDPLRTFWHPLLGRNTGSLYTVLGRLLWKCNRLLVIIFKHVNQAGLILQ